MSVLSERLRELRGNSTQSEMARQLGMARPQWIRYENGESVPGADTLEKICRTHACSADWLLGLDNLRSATPPPPPDRSRDKASDLKKAIITLLKEY